MGLTKGDKLAPQIALLSLTSAVVIRTAWMSDDAEITLRCVMNLINGYGPTFNIDERVQPFTHPLWFLVIAAGTLVTKNVFAATFTLSIFLSLATIWLLVSRLSTSFWAGMLAGVGLLLSKAYVDYSTSGLENPLSHFLLVLGLLLGFRCLESEDHSASMTDALMVLGLTYLTRPDLILLVLPFSALLVCKTYSNLGTTVREVTIAITPVALWTLFSLFYYGAPFPNTFYAKLGIGLPATEMYRQGIVYLADSFSFDPVTLTFVSMGILLAVRGSSGLKAIAAGIVLYLAYVISIGGDFMSGRFLTVPLLASAVILSRWKMTLSGIAIVALVLVATGSMSFPATVLAGRAYVFKGRPSSWVGDERAFMFPSRGLATINRAFFRQPDWTPGPMRVVNVCGLLGVAGLEGGPNTHFIDPCGLSDPLLARLPMRTDRGWAVGHFYRQVPSGYTESLLKDENLLVDPATKSYWDVIRLATRGPLFSLTRFKAVARLNLGLVKKPDMEAYRSGVLPPLVVDLGTLSKEVVAGPNIACDAPTNTRFDSSIEVKLPSPTELSSIDISLTQNDRYVVEYQTQGTYRRLAEFGQNGEWGMVRHQIKFPYPTEMTDRLRITAYARDGCYSIGHLFLNR
jgi:arabinofuranosyltransferase